MRFAHIFTITDKFDNLKCQKGQNTSTPSKVVSYFGLFVDVLCLSTAEAGCDGVNTCFKIKETD